MTRDGENETSFAQNATLLRISTSRKERESPPAPLRAGSFDFARGKLSGYAAVLRQNYQLIIEGSYLIR